MFEKREAMVVKASITVQVARRDVQKRLGISRADEAGMKLAAGNLGTPLDSFILYVKLDLFFVHRVRHRV